MRQRDVAQEAPEFSVHRARSPINASRFPHRQAKACRLGRLAAVTLLLLGGLLLPAMLRLPGTAAGAVSLGGGTYEMIASEFGNPGDSGFGPGATTSSGYVLQGDDNLVALPACTESSCPWLGFGYTDPQWGKNTGCIEDDGLCWVQLVSIDTGQCTVAPVLDVGPLFTKDNWWWPKDGRIYPLPQGEPAAVAAAQGADLGYGPGISDAGDDVADNFWYAPGIDIAAGTWKDLGLDPSQGVAGVVVSLLWQTGVSHQDACGSVGGDFSGNATVSSALNLRDGPGLDANVLLTMPGGSRVTVTGGSDNGYYPVTYGEVDGWASGGYLELDNGGGSGSGDENTATTTDDLNLRAGPSFADDIITTMPAGATVSLTGGSENGYVSVSYDGMDGWAYAGYLSGVSASGAGGGSAATTDNLNLRTGPSSDDGVMTTVPAGDAVSLTGGADNGYLSVSYNGLDGWVAGWYLGAVTTDRLNLRTGPSTDDGAVLVIPAGDWVTLTGDGANGYVGVVYNGQYGWVAASYLTG